MSRFSRFEIIENTPIPFFTTTTITRKTIPLNPYYLHPTFPFDDHLDFFNLDLLNPNPSLFELSSTLNDFDTIIDLTQIKKTTPFYTSTRRVHRRVNPLSTDESLYLQTLCDRVSFLELGFDRLINGKSNSSKVKVEERKYTWTAETKDRKYKWTAEIKGVGGGCGGEKKLKGRGGGEKNYKWTAEIKGRDDDDEEVPISRTYPFKAVSGDEGGECSEEKKEKKKEKKKCEKGGRVVEIEEPSTGHRAFVLRQAFAKRTRAVEKSKGKRKVLSPQDAAIMIQMSFRAYLIRRSQALRALRELAIAKSKLKEIRALFNNFTYRRRVSRDAEERQRFSEKIIVLLLTVDAIEGADLMVRAAKRSMVDELEAMLDVVDPQPGKSLSMRRRTFDMPDSIIQRELAAGVAQVVQMLDQDTNGAETFEACL